MMVDTMMADTAEAVAVEVATEMMMVTTEAVVTADINLYNTR